MSPGCTSTPGHRRSSDVESLPARATSVFELLSLKMSLRELDEQPAVFERVAIRGDAREGHVLQACVELTKHA